MWWIVGVVLAQEPEATDPAPAAAPEAPQAVPVPEEAPAPEAAPTGDEADAVVRSRRDVIDVRNAERAARIFRQRALANHPFVTPQLARSALPTSHAATRFGAALVYAPATDSSPTESLWTAASGGLEGSVRFGRWVALRGELGGTAGLQSAAGDVPQIAAEAGWDVSGGVPIRLVHARSTALTLEPIGGYFDSTQLAVTDTLSTLADQALEGGGIDVDAATARMVTRAQGGGGGLSLALAQAGGKVFGLQLSVGGQYQALVLRATDDDGPREVVASQVKVDAGVALSLDANPVPFAVMVEYAVGASVGLGEAAGLTSLQHQVGLGLYLNGLTNTIGVEGFGRLAPGSLSAGAQVLLRAYF